MDIKRRALTLSPPGSEGKLRITYFDCPPRAGVWAKGVIVLLHGFPQTSFQFRRVVPSFTGSGYRCVVPDYRGAGGSSKTFVGGAAPDFRKSTMAGDIVALLDALDIAEAVHLIGHDIGGMVAFALASRYPQRVRSLCWGECPLPGTKAFERDTTDPERVRQQFHFAFHCAPDGLPEALVAGRESTYISHFFNKLAHNLDAFPSDVVDEYVRAYSQPGAMACAFAVYRAFDADARENKAWMAEHGKCTVPSMILNGAQSRHAEEAQEMAQEVIEGTINVTIVEDAGHYVVEESPEGFVKAMFDFYVREGLA